MSEGVNAPAVSSEGSPPTTTTTTTTTTIIASTATSTMTTTLASRDEPKTPPSPPPLPPPPSQSDSEGTKTAKKQRKNAHSFEGTFFWIDGKKIRSALTHRKWPPRPRRVSFPTNDSELVTGYLEPANPWEHAENVNIEDLISSYKTSCERHCTEPLQNVVAQLEKLDIIEDERCPELCLKHEPLDQNRCEPLEEILKRVQFEKLDLEATSLDDESAVILFDMLEYYQSAKHLDMSNNGDIGPRGWHACAHMIKKTTCLEILEARDIILTQQHMNILKRPLQVVSHLHVLKLENCGLAGRSFAILVSALKMNTELKELYLADNGLKQEDAIQLGALLRINNHLQLLDISNNGINDEGVRDILDGLITQSSNDRDGKGLTILVLWNNALTKSSSGHFTQAIAHSITLETLNIGKNSVSNELLKMAQEALIKSRTLLQLGMQSTDITCEGALLLAEIIETNRTLQRIDLRDNNIQMTGLTAISFAMKKNTSITQLDLDDKPWSKSPAAMHRYLDLVTEIRGYCARNEEPTSTDESTEESSSPQHRSRLSSVSSRKISLTCQTLPRSPPSMTPTSNDIATRSMLEPKRTSGGRLRSPAPSPIPSPVASPIPSPSRSRFVVSRVSEASLSSTNSSTSSSPVTPPSLASPPTCFFPSASGGSSRFRVVTIAEPASTMPPAKSVVTSTNANVTIGFNYTVHTPEDAGTDNSDSVFRAEAKEDHRATDKSSASVDVNVSYEEKIETSSVVKADKADSSAEDLNVEIKETTLVNTKETRKVSPVSSENPKVEDNQTGSAEAQAQRSDIRAPTESASNTVETSVADGTKESGQPAAEVARVMHSVDSEIIETKANTEKRTEESLREEIIVSFQPEPKKPEPVQRQATSLERLLGLFQHPGSLFSGSSFTERTETKNPLQEGVNSMIALGDKFQQYIREGRSSSKSGSEDSPSRAPLQRSVSDASRSTIKLDPVKSLSIPQLSSIQATCTRELASSKEGFALPENCTGTGHREAKPDAANSTSRKIFVVEESPTDNTAKSDEVPRISDDLPLPETLQSSAKVPLEENVPSETAASVDAITPNRVDTSTEIVNSASLNVTSEGKTTICAPKLKDIPEYSVLEIRTSSAKTDASAGLSSRDDVVGKSAENDAGMKCDSSTTDSINDPSCKNSSLCKVMCDISGVETVHTLGSMDDVHNFLNTPSDDGGQTMLDAPEECAVISVSSSEADDPPTAIAAEAVEEIKNVNDNDPEKCSLERPRDSSEATLLPGTTKLEDAISNDVEEESDRTTESTERKQTIVANNVDLSLPVFNNLCTNNLIYADGRNAQTDRDSGKRFDDAAIVAENNELSDTVEEFLPIDAAASLTQTTATRELNAAILTNNCININSHPGDLVTETKPELDIIVSEPHEDNETSGLTDEPAAITVTDNKIPAIDEIVAEEPITFSEQFVSLPNAICARREDAIEIPSSTKIEVRPRTKVEIAFTEDDEYVPAAAIEQVSTSISEDSDYSSKLSVDDVRPGELSLNGSTANSPANDMIEQIVAETSIMNNSLECINIHSDGASLKTTEHRSFVRAAVESVLTSIMNVSNSTTKVTTSEVKTSESTEDLMFKMTDITTDASLSVSEVTSSIVTTVQECGDATNLAYFEAGQSSRSPTNLYIDKSMNVHRNSQDSGIEETTVSISDDNGIESNGQPRESFQESVDSGIDSECSSVCARVDVGADVQKERARDPGKPLIVDVAVHDEIIGFSTSLVTKEGILAADGIAKIGNPTYKTAIEGTINSNKLAEVISMGGSNKATTDRPNVSVRSPSPE